MKRALGLLPLLAALVLSPMGCDWLDPTEVENPRTTDEDLAEAQEPVRSLLPGLRAQFARMQASTVVLTEAVSDNYSIHGTGLNSAYDFPGDIRPQTVNATGVTGLYWNAQELRSLADFVLDELVPNDDQASASDIAEAHYFRGMAFLFLGENVVGAPVVEDGPAVTPDSLLNLALADLTQAAGTDAIGLAAHAAMARAYRWLGDGTNAISSAQTVLGADPAFLRIQDYDRGNLENWPYYYVVSRTLREFQPLPRLDFLDPKYLDFDAGIPVAKAEEMHLIQAEALMADGQWANGAEQLALAIEAAQARGTTSYFDDDPRVDATFVIRPRDQEIAVQASPSSPARNGLIFERPGTIDAATVSGTSLNADSIRAIPVANETDLLHALYLARQEILFLEGRRMADLGIRLPIMLREIEANPSLALGDFGTEIVIPTFIPPSGELDTYTPISPYPAGTAAEDVDVEPDVLTVIIDHDMNAVLAANRSALPLF
jgi:tetratricopeptide (TPR) repeat protein